MRKLIILILAAAFITCGIETAQADALDLSTFTSDGDVYVDLAGGTVTMDETSSLWSSYFYDDNFFVAADALSLSVDYALTSGIDDVDWIVTQVDYIYDLEEMGPTSGTYTLDLTPYQNTTISLAFGLEADWSDLGYDSVATFSNFDLVTVSNSGPAPVPEPATMVLFGTGLAGLIGASKRKRSKKSE